MEPDHDELSAADREAMELMTKLRGKVAVAKSLGRIAAAAVLAPVSLKVARVKKVAGAAMGAAVHVAKQRAADAIAEANAAPTSTASNPAEAAE